MVVANGRLPTRMIVIVFRTPRDRRTCNRSTSLIRALLTITLCCMIALSCSSVHAWSTFWDGTGEPSLFTGSGAGGTTVNLGTVNRGMLIEDTVTSGGHNFYYRSTTGTSVSIGTRFRVEAYTVPIDGTGKLCLMTLQAGSSPSPRLSVGIKTVGGVDKFVLLNVKDGAVLHELQPVDDQWHEARLYCSKTGASYQFWWDNDAVRSGTAATSTTSGTRAIGASADYGSTGTSRVIFDYFGYNTGVFTPEKAAPNPGTAWAPQYANGPATVAYSGASDSAGICKVYLWYKKGTGAWTLFSENESTSSSGSFAFTFPNGYGTYYFKLQAQDKNGNFSPEPTGDTYDGSTVYQSSISYSMSNGYVSFTGSKGEMRNVRVDPTGAGNYRLIAKEIYLGEMCPVTGTLGYSIEGGTLTVDPVQVYSASSTISVTARDTATRLYSGQTLGQSFTTTTNGLASVSVNLPTWYTTGSALTMRLHRDGPGGSTIAEKRCENVTDNGWQTLYFAPQNAGTYYIELSQASGTIGWWTASTGTIGQMYVNGVPVGGGSRCFKATVYNSTQSRITITLNGSQLTTAVSPSTSQKWRVNTPWERNGYELTDPARIPFYRFIGDKGHCTPAAQLKRRDEVSGPDATQWIYATGNGEADVRFTAPSTTAKFAMDGYAMTITLGSQFGFTVEPHSMEAVPSFYPAFYTSDPAFDAALNNFLYDRVFSWGIGGVAADWFEWTALINYWMARPGLMEHWRSNLQTYPVDAEGYVYTWGNNKGWPFPDNNIYDTRHFTTNPNFILACWRYYAWTKDRAFLTANTDRIRRAMNFMLTQLDGAAGILVLPDKDHGGTPNDVASNYWDDLPFGGRSAYENAYYYASLLAMAEIETALGDKTAAQTYTDLAATCRQRYNQLFWNDTAGRYIACIDENGVRRDYGFTFVNMEAATYGLPDQTRAQRIYNWMESGDTYSRWQFAPRANTIDCRSWWYLNGTGEIPAQNFDTHLENGGAILYTSGYDIMARARYFGADNACARLQGILNRYMEPDRLAGGAPLYRGENNGWQVGTDVPFPESGIVPASFLYAFIGVEANVKGLTITPNLPSRFSHAGVRNLRYQGMMLDIRVTRTSVRITCTDPGKEFTVEETIEPGGSYTFGERISSIKAWPDGTFVMLTDKALYYRNGSVAYIEEADRSSGIRIQGTIPADNQLVSLTGTLRTGASGERYIEVTSLTPGAPAAIEPVGMTNREIGGGAFGLQAGVRDWALRPVPGSDPVEFQRILGPAIGTNNIGMWVRAWGRVTAVGADFYYIDDGSGIDDGDPAVKGLRVSGICPGAVGDYVSVTGISSCMMKDGVLVRLLVSKDHAVVAR